MGEAMTAPKEFGHCMPSVAAMRHDLHDLGYDEMSRREKCSMWFTYYWRPSRRWMPKVVLWWGRHVRRYPQRPPFDLDPIAQHFGWVDGVPACEPWAEDGTCHDHAWEVPGGD